MSVLPMLPVPEARELPDDEAWRSLFDDFGLLDDPITEPMPLQLEPLPESDWLAAARKTLGRPA
jgi:hypothetical protein